MEKLNKLSLPAVILIASIILGGFYFLSEINKQRSIEKQQQIKIEQEGQEKLAEQEAKEGVKQALDTCIANEDENYANQWHAECKRFGKLTSKCIDIQELTFSDYLDKYGLTPETYNLQRGLSNTGELVDDFLTGGRDYLKRRGDECSCALPLSLVDRIEDIFEKNRNECLKRYPQ